MRVLNSLSRTRARDQIKTRRLIYAEAARSQSIQSDNARALVGEQHSRHRRGPDTRELDYAKTGERSHRRFGFSDSVQHVSAISAVHLMSTSTGHGHMLSRYLLASFHSIRCYKCARDNGDM